MCGGLTETYCGIYKTTLEWRLLKVENGVGYGTSRPVRFTRHHRKVPALVGKILEHPTFVRLCRSHSTAAMYTRSTTLEC